MCPDSDRVVALHSADISTNTPMGQMYIKGHSAPHVSHALKFPVEDCSLLCLNAFREVGP